MLQNLTKKVFCVKNEKRTMFAGLKTHNSTGRSPMFQKVFDPHMTLLLQARKGTLTQKNVVYLLKKGADINFMDQNGWTPLLYATYGNRTNSVRILLEKGANPDIQDLQGHTALMFAILFRRKSILKLLIKHKAKLSIKDCEGWTALNFSHHVSFAEKLLLKEMQKRSKEKTRGRYIPNQTHWIYSETRN